MNTARFLGALVLAASGLTLAAPAHAAGRVGVTNEQGEAVVDPTYATSLTIRGSGFQAVRNGHGGVYVFFGTVSDGWRPSAGGQTGRDYLYVPDTEGKNNAGYQRFVAFPGSDTADSANGGSMTGSGSFSTTITVPGAVFQAVDRDNNVRTVDCRKVTCGVITIGAHGVTSAPNETFTPVRVSSMYAAGDPTPTSNPTTTSAPSTTVSPTVTGSSPTTSPPAQAPAIVRPAGKPTLSIDRKTARAGAVLSFTARGLTPGRQVTATLDDGESAAGPLTVGADGSLAGVIPVPVELGPGTHRLRLVGVRVPPVNFPLTGLAPVGSAVDSAAVPEEADDRVPMFFAAGSGVVLLVAVGRLMLLRRRGGRAVARA